MARPFGEREKSGKSKEIKKSDSNSHNPDKSINFHGTTLQNGIEKDEAKRKHFHTEKSSGNLEAIHYPSSGETAASNVYYVNNSSIINCGPSFINATNRISGKSSIKAPVSLKEPRAITGREIKVRKGIFQSNRVITSNDIRIASEDIGDDWRLLVRNLPGITSYSSSFHQTLVDALDENDEKRLAEIALFRWKELFPQASTIGNLAQTLFNIGHPDIVSHLKP